MGRRCRLFLWAIISVFAAGSFANHAFAIAGPNAADFYLVPGESAVLSIPFYNDRAVESVVDFSLFVAEFAEGGDTPTFRLPTAEEAAWIQTSVSRVTLAPNAVQSVHVTATAPSTASEGVRTFALIATDHISGPVSLSYGAATLLFLTIGHPDVLSECPVIARQSDRDVSVQLRNVGSGILIPVGTVQLRGPFGILFSEEPLYTQGNRILPGQTRTWTVPIPNIPWWAFGNVMLRVNDGVVRETECPSIVVYRTFALPIGIGVVLFGIGVAAILRRR